ncbi:NAD-binding protein [Pleurocapsales cyanobacterium LEGE 10410]|nr:NAD-binding protein [Pleurocapsales cyanobacterium LEGE 10410]
MKIILIGGSKLAYFLTKQFASKNYYTTIINSDINEAKNLSRTLKATVIHGEGSDPHTLSQAGAYQADVVLSLTTEDEDNLIACQIAQKEYGVPRTIALVNDPENQPIFEKLGITVAFSATQIIASLIEQQTASGDIQNLLPIAEGKVNVTEIALQEDNPVVGKTIDEIQLPNGTLIACILRQGEVIVPSGENSLQALDRLITIGQPESYGQLMRLLCSE